MITYIINSFVYHGDSEKFLYDFKEFHLNLINKIIYGIPLIIELVIYAITAIFIFIFVLLIILVIISTFLKFFRND